MTGRLVLLLFLLVVSCASQQPRTPAPSSPSTTATAGIVSGPSPTFAAIPPPSPTPDEPSAQVMQLLAARDEAQRKGDETALLAVLDASAPAEFREREVTLLRMAEARAATPPRRELVLLFSRGGGPWLMVEGIPLWLTDDRRQPEVDRLVAANAIWDLPHLLEGPRAIEEFFAGYAQASSFVRYLAARYGDRAVISAWEAARAKPTFEEAFRGAFGLSPSDAWGQWRASLRSP